MFTEIDKLLATGQELNIRIFKTEDNLTVAVLPKDISIKDEAVQKIQPIRITGTAAELDEGFISSLTQGLPVSTGLLSNIKEHEASVQVAQKNSAMEKERKEKIDRLIKSAEKLESEEKYREALDKYNEVLAIDASHSGAIKKAKEMTEKSTQTSLF